MRGIDCVQIPTSLLAMVDSSVGGKTAVDLPAGKNLMGVFSQPKAVLIDPQALDTLPERERACGWGEMIKYAGIDARMNQLVHEALAGIEPGSPAPLPTVDLILAAIDVKRRIVEADEREAGERRLLNLGHTVGPCRRSGGALGAFSRRLCRRRHGNSHAGFGSRRTSSQRNARLISRRFSPKRGSHRPFLRL